MKLTFVTRPSKLARWQTQHVIQLLESLWDDLTCQELVITTQGDRTLDTPLPEIGGKGLFTSELEQALLAGLADAAVHSLKDLPAEQPPGLVLAAIPPRADCRDVWICSGGFTLDELPAGSVVGTSSLRRQAQLLAQRPDLKTQSIRGNVDTRLRKALAGQYDAIILAAAGVTRLGLQGHITQYLSLERMLPAPGQGALAVQCRAADVEIRQRLATIHNHLACDTVTAERTFLAALGGGCSLPVGAVATHQAAGIKLQGIILSPDGSRAVRLTALGADPHALGQELARQAFAQGAAGLLSEGDLTS